MMAKIFQDHFGVLDLETLGSTDDAVILSLGLTISRYDDKHKTFDELVKEGLCLKFGIKEQMARGRRTQKRVIEWWSKQDAEAKSVLRVLPTDISLYSLPTHLEAHLNSLGLKAKDIDWYDRKSFDLSKLQYLYEEELGGDIPWKPTQEFEVSTAFRMLGFDRYAGIQVKDIPGATYHNALHDAAVDHLRMFKALHSESE